VRRREPGLGSQAASTLVLLGFVTVLGLVFAAGVLAGRHWPRLLPSLGPSAPRAEAEARRAPERGRPAQPAPVLSYYQELTAPITAAAPPPPKPRPARPTKPEAPNPETPPAPPRRPTPEPEAVPVVTAPARPSPEAALPERRFTIQVAAFKTRPQAENMRRTLVDGGYDAYVSEGESPNGARYRVRVGSYPTRDDAQQTAQRLTGERRLPTFITAR
jgi:DedD protein